MNIVKNIPSFILANIASFMSILGVIIISIVIFLSNQDHAVKWSAISSLLMVFITYVTLLQNQNQLNELKRQWLDEHQPNLEFTIHVANFSYFLKIENTGTRMAKNVTLNFNEDFINALSQKNRCYFEHLNRPFNVSKQSPRYIFIGWCEEINDKWKDLNVCMEISGKYNGGQIDQIIIMDEYINRVFFKVEDSLTMAIEGIEKGLSSQNSITNYMTIQKSLDSIAHSLDKIMKFVEKD